MGRIVAGCLVVAPVYLACLLLLKAMKAILGLMAPVAKMLPKSVPAENFIALNFVVMPLAAILIARMLRLDQPLGEALLLLGVAAGAPFLPKLAGVAKGNLAFAVGLMALLMVLTVGYMPLVLPLLLEGVSVDPLKIARSLLLLMLLPLGVGLATRAKLPRLAERARPRSTAFLA